MRNTILLAMLILSAIACKPKNPANQADASAKPVMVELSVTGMMCMGCVETVRSSIAQLQGVDTVSVSLDSANAKVTFKPQITDTVIIRKAVELNGYKVTATKRVGGVQ
jgi:copper chaperone CopZ